MFSLETRYLIVVPLAAAIYYGLAYMFNGWIWAAIPGLDTFQNWFGHLVGLLVWAHLVHGLALLVAALPSAWLLAWLCRPRAAYCAAVAGAITVAGSFTPTLLNSQVRGLLDATAFVHMAIDSIRFVGLLMLVTWVVGTRLVRTRSIHV